MTPTGSSLFPSANTCVFPNPESVTIDQFINEGNLKMIGSGYQVRVMVNSKFPNRVVKEYNCATLNLQYLFEREVSVIRSIEARLQDEKLSRVVFPKLFETKVNGAFLFECFPRIYPPNATSSEDDGEMIGISFSKQPHRVDGQYSLAGRGRICEPPHLEKYFGAEVPFILKELGKAFALLHFKAFVICHDVEIVIGKFSPTEPLKLFIIDFDRAHVEPMFSRENFLLKHGQNFTTEQYFRYQFSFDQSDVFKDFSKVDEKFKKPFVHGYIEAAENLGFRSEAESIATKLNP